MTLRRILTESLFRILHHATYRFIEGYTAVQLDQEVKQDPLLIMDKWKYMMDFDEIIALRVWCYKNFNKRIDLVSKRSI